jgi:hypothetical protein
VRWEDEPDRTGVRYYLGKDVVLVDATVTYKTEGSIEGGGDRLSIEKGFGFVNSEATIATRTIPDSRRYFLLDMAPSGSQDRTLAINVSEDGLLTGINAETKDRTGEAITSIGKFVGGIVGAATGLNIFSFDKRLATDHHLRVFRTTVVGRRLKEGTPQHDRALARFRQLPLPAIAYIDLTLAGLSLWDEQAVLELALVEAQGQRYALLDQVRLDKTAAAVKLRQAQANTLETVEADLRQRLARAQEAFQAALTSYLANNSIPAVTSKRRVLMQFDLTEIPPSCALPSDVRWNEDTLRTRLRSLPSGYSKMDSLLTQAKIVLTIATVPNLDKALCTAESAAQAVVSDDAGRRAASASAPGADSNHAGKADSGHANPGTSDTKTAPPALDDGWPGPTPTSRDDAARVWFRQAQPVTLRVLTLSPLPPQAKPQQALVTTEQRQVLLLHPSMPASSVRFDKRAFADGKLKLAFDSHGRVTTLERSSTSALAGATGAAVSALTAIRDEAVTSIQKVQTFDEVRQKIGQNRLQATVDSLTKEQSALNLRLAIEGTTATAELAAKKKEVDAQLEAAKSELALQSFQGTTEQALESARLQADAARLRAEVDNLKLQLDILKQQIELERLKKEQATVGSNSTDGQ